CSRTDFGHAIDTGNCRFSAAPPGSERLAVSVVIGLIESMTNRRHQSTNGARTAHEWRMQALDLHGWDALAGLWVDAPAKRPWGSAVEAEHHRGPLDDVVLAQRPDGGTDREELGRVRAPR